MNDAASAISLDDKYDLDKSRVFITGTQAIIRLLLTQHERDRRAGLNTAGFVSGYRGSPLGAVDTQILRAAEHLAPRNILFQAGINEEVAATACWGTQQAEMRGEGKYDGVFSIWYGKGPGVDRAGDALRHANMAGTSPNGGVLAIMGDDHTAESSTIAHQSEFAFVDLMMPIFSPAGVQEIIDYGIYGLALSRYAGIWSSLKGVKDTIESTAVIDGAIDRVSIVKPDFVLPPGGLNIRPRDGFLTMEARLHEQKLPAALAFIQANRLNRVVVGGGPMPKLGIITSGKSYLDVRQALDALGIDEARAAEIGLTVYKIGCPWPLEPQGLRAFARGLDMVIIVEEKRSLIETQVREILYGMTNAPVCVGKKDEDGKILFPSIAALDSNDIAIAIGERALKFWPRDELRTRVERLKVTQKHLAETVSIASRTPHFCSGCPHNSSTVVPEGMRAYAGIGCHTLALWMDRSTEGFTQMGGEGANWVGEAPFSTRDHVFQNMGDGTYTHSGTTAIRFAVSSAANITYKILFNDAVAMTGGQGLDGGLTIDALARQLAAEGVRRIALVTDETDKYPAGLVWPEILTLHHRRDIDAVQRMLADVKGVSAMIYDQTCAIEKRRRRKRGVMPDPDKRVIINELVCEGCGDCSVASNCVSVQPVETEFGRKRLIDQSNCNKDFSCVNGFCPSFVTVHGARVKKASVGVASTDGWADLSPPAQPALDHPFSILITGVGGTGVVTIGAILGMAAHLDGKASGIIDMAGMAQKGGAVVSHVRLAARADDIHAIRIAAGEADLVLGADTVVTGGKTTLSAVRHGSTSMIVNTAEIMPGDFTRNADFRLPTERLRKAILDAAGAAQVTFINATGIASALLGNAIGANLFMLGLAVQKGRVPLSPEAIEQAITLNGEAVAMNLSAFQWGRRAAQDQARVEALAAPFLTPTNARELSTTLAERMARRSEFLKQYQNRRYARRYLRLVERVIAAEKAILPHETALAEAVTRSLFKLMAYKDEYEVARLYTDGSFMKQLKSQFEGKMRLEFHLAPPLRGKKDAKGLPIKQSYGPRMMLAFRLLAPFKFLRGTPLDPFGYTKERRTERHLIRTYEKRLGELITGLTPLNHITAVEIASLPEKIRGFGHVKERNLALVLKEEAALLEKFHNLIPQQAMAAE